MVWEKAGEIEIPLFFSPPFSPPHNKFGCPPPRYIQNQDFQIREIILGNLCLWNTESRNLLLVESGILSFGIRNPTQGIQNPTKDWDSESKFHWQGIGNPPLRVKYPSLFLLPYVGWFLIYWFLNSFHYILPLCTMPALIKYNNYIIINYIILYSIINYCWWWLNQCQLQWNPGYNEPLYYEVLCITNNFLYPR